MSLEHPYIPLSLFKPASASLEHLNVWCLDSQDSTLIVLYKCANLKRRSLLHFHVLGALRVLPHAILRSVRQRPR